MQVTVIQEETAVGFRRKRRKKLQKEISGQDAKPLF